MKLPPAHTLRTLLACGLFATFGPACQAPAADPKPAANDPKAQQLLEEVGRAYQHLSAYSDQGEFVLEATVGGKAESIKSSMKISLERPNKLRLDAGEVQVASDGKTMTTAVVPFKKYTTETAPKAIAFETFRQGPLGSVLFGGPSAPAMYIVLNMLVGSDPAKSIATLGGVLVLDSDRQARAPCARRSASTSRKGPTFACSSIPKPSSSEPSISFLMSRSLPRRGSRRRSRSNDSAGRPVRSRPRISRLRRSPTRLPRGSPRSSPLPGPSRLRSIRSTSSSGNPPRASPSPSSTALARPGRSPRPTSRARLS